MGGGVVFGDMPHVHAQGRFPRREFWVPSYGSYIIPDTFRDELERARKIEEFRRVELERRRKIEEARREELERRRKIEELRRDELEKRRRVQEMLLMNRLSKMAAANAQENFLHEAERARTLPQPVYETGEPSPAKPNKMSSELDYNQPTADSSERKTDGTDRSSKPLVFSVPVTSSTDVNHMDRSKSDTFEDQSKLSEMSTKIDSNDSDETVNAENRAPDDMKDNSIQRAAISLQSHFRGHLVRKTKPLKHLRTVAKVRVQYGRLREQACAAEFPSIIKSNTKARLEFTENLMNLLLELDSIQGAHPDVRDIRKAATRDVVNLQERIDALLSNDEVADGNSIEGEAGEMSTSAQDIRPVQETDVNMGGGIGEQNSIES